MSANRTVTAVELAGQINWDEKRLRGWLRTAWRAGHPLLRSHGHNDPWIFTADEADQLRREAVRGSWKANHNSLGIKSTGTPTAVLMSVSTPVPGSGFGVNAPCSAAGVAEALARGPSISAGNLLGIAVPRGPGLYAWWHKPGLLPGVVHRACGPTLAADGALELAYVGIAGSLQKAPQPSPGQQYRVEHSPPGPWGMARWRSGVDHRVAQLEGSTRTEVRAGAHDVDGAEPSRDLGAARITR